MDTVAGVYFPRGGMHAVPAAMADAVVRAGGTVRYDEPVTALERRGERVTAVLTEHGRIPCDAVVLTPTCPSPTASSDASPAAPSDCGTPRARS